MAARDLSRQVLRKAGWLPLTALMGWIAGSMHLTICQAFDSLEDKINGLGDVDEEHFSQFLRIDNKQTCMERNRQSSVLLTYRNEGSS